MTKFDDTPYFLKFIQFDWFDYSKSGGSVGEFFGGVIVGGRIGEPLNRQCAALFD